MERSLPADRNLAHRIYAALVFVPLIILIAYAGGIAFAVLIEALILLGLAELWGMLESAGRRPMRVTGYVLATLVCLFSARFSAEPVMILMGFSFMLLCAIVCLAAARSFGRIGETLLPTVGGVLYVGWLFSFQIPLRESAERLLPSSSLHPDTAGWIVLLFGYSLVWTCDTSAYFIGKRFGVRKLIPSISPGKTVAGALGGLVLTVAVALLYRSLFLGMLPLSLTLVIGVTSAVLAQAGDIFESALKRKAGVKDSSRLIPGHGGILDRFDGMLFALPAIYYILLAGAGL